MIIPSEILDIITTSAMSAPAIIGSDNTAAKPAGSSEGMSAVGKAVVIGFIILILVNGQLSSGMTFALIGGIIAYFYFNGKH